MRNILGKLRDVFFSIVIFPIVFLYKEICKSKIVFCECYIHNTILPFKKRNWGDDLNKYLFEYISSIKIVNLPFSKVIKYKNLEVYSLIGSVLSFYKIENKIVYGTGTMNPNWPILGNPEKIISVRGPKTRQVLVDNGINCPENYGDPVLLLPIFYKGDVKKSDKIGVIFNMGSGIVNIEGILSYFKGYEIKIISMTKYKRWTDVVDEICSCQFIISESLHGLIVAETYGIPNVWVEFVNHPDYWDFKYKDFYESIGKNENIISIKSEDNIDILFEKIKHWKKGNIDYKKLIDLYPFEICKSFSLN